MVMETQRWGARSLAGRPCGVACEKATRGSGGVAAVPAAFTSHDASRRRHRRRCGCVRGRSQSSETDRRKRRATTAYAPNARRRSLCSFVAIDDADRYSHQPTQHNPTLMFSSPKSNAFLSLTSLILSIHLSKSMLS